MNRRKHYKTIIISDIHLGTAGSRVREVTAFLKQNNCETLILNGDIIDGWQLKKYGSWKKKHTSFLRTVLKKIELDDTKVYYLRGNHDDFLDQIIPFSIGPNFSIKNDLIIQSGGKRFYVTHGDILDHVTSNMKWLAHLGDVGYTFLLWLNKKYNNYRLKKGKSYYSLSKKIKNSIKLAVNYISDYEKKISSLARVKNCDGVICGHIHQPAIKNLNNTIYMNSGDWVENNTALVEDFDNNWNLIYYHLHCKVVDAEIDEKQSTIIEDQDEYEDNYFDLFELK